MNDDDFSNTNYRNQKETTNNTCICGKEIEKPYIRCDECHNKYLDELIKSPKK